MTTKTTSRIIRAFINGVRPPPIQGVAEWCEKNYYLPAESAAEPGLISFKRTPYSYGICEAFDDVETEFVTLQLAAQLAKTTILLGILGKTCATAGEGAPCLFLLPTLDNAEMISKERFAPMIKSSPSLRKNLLTNKDRKASGGSGGQTTLQKSFRNGAMVTFVGSNAPAALASRPIKILLSDECDRFAASAGQEGDPLSLAKKRTSTFRGNGRKICTTSTPTLAGISTVEREYLLSDQRKYFVPCPHCGHRHVMEFDYIHWEGDDHTTAYYACPDQGCVWTEADRLDAISKGEWIATRPEVKGHAGFQANALLSPWVGQATNAAYEYIHSRGNPMLERVFVNTFLGETYSSDDLRIDEQTLIDRMTPIGLRPVPRDVLLLTAGVDIQSDRAEVQVIGWNDKQKYILAHKKIYGDPTGDQLWEDLHEFLTQDFPHELGNPIRITATAIDSGFMTQTVKDFCMKYEHKRFYAIKGVSGERAIWAESSNRNAKTKGKLWLVGVDDGKTMLMESLKNGDRDSVGFIHIADMDTENAEFVKQLISEYRDVKFVGNKPVQKWERKSTGHRAEALDCFVYAYAVRQTLSPNWKQRKMDLTRAPAPTKAPDRVMMGVADPKPTPEDDDDDWAQFD